MGSKNNPGKFDCYEAAHPDEPLFTLLARDPAAPGMLRIWAALREGNWIDAHRQFARLMETSMDRPITYGSEEHHRDCRKAQEAYGCADDMEGWEKPVPQAPLDFETRSPAPLAGPNHCDACNRDTMRDFCPRCGTPLP